MQRRRRGLPPRPRHLARRRGTVPAQVLRNLLVFYLAMFVVVLGVVFANPLSKGDGGVPAMGRPLRAGPEVAEQASFMERLLSAAEGLMEKAVDLIRAGHSRAGGRTQPAPGASSAGGGLASRNSSGQSTARNFLRGAIYAVADLDIEDPKTALSFEIPVMSQTLSPRGGSQRSTSRALAMRLATQPERQASHTSSGEDPEGDPPAEPGTWEPGHESPDAAATTGVLPEADDPAPAASGDDAQRDSAPAAAESGWGVGSKAGIAASLQGSPSADKSDASGADGASQPAKSPDIRNPSGPGAGGAVPDDRKSVPWDRPAGRDIPAPPANRYIAYGKNPLVAIYHTHSSETYRASEGKDYDWGKTTGVTTVGAEMARTLWESYGISTVHSTHIHDYPVWREGYARSLNTIRDVLDKHPSVDVVLDIHRDSVPMSTTGLRTVKIDGKDVARVFIVVTDDRFGLSHPNWRKNYSFAMKLHEKANQLYPGLSRGVAVSSNGRFNQHVHPHAVILEIGGDLNTKDEAVGAARLMARVVAEVVKEMRQ